MEKQTVKILYIAGATRSGSTLLSRLLGEIDGFINVGEALRWLFNTLRMSRLLLVDAVLMYSSVHFGMISHQ
jgi:hypothetical protein